MFKKKFAQHEALFNDPFFSPKPSLSNDPVARQTRWKPVNDDTGNVRTHKLVKVHPDRIEFRAACGNIIFSLLFPLAGVGCMFIFLPIASQGSSSPAFFLAFLTSLIFIFGGGWMLHFSTAPMVFDKKKGLFWRGRKIPDQIFESEAETSDSVCRLERIHAVQLIDHSDYRNNYELNLVLKDGNRVPVMSYHGGKGSRSKKKMEREARSDAACLSVLLDKPIWDKRTKEIVVSFGKVG
ncbi:MAG: hypothetical protein D3925_17540 [Candidatus Electrothrix sp. AR5]|nr:hypothetical protein [Candidatus Electrothrix sp. AR5]